LTAIVKTKAHPRVSLVYQPVKPLKESQPVVAG